MSKRSFRTALVVVLATVVIAIAVIAWLVHSALQYPTIKHVGTGREVVIDIRPGNFFGHDATVGHDATFTDVTNLLAANGVISKPAWFRLYAMYRGDTTKVKSGKFLLRDNMTPKDVLDALIAGVKDINVSVTLPEGQNMLEYFDAIAAAKVCTAADLLALARNPQFLAAHGIVGDSVEGYLFPDTYDFRVDEKPEKVLERMINRHQRVWNDLVRSHPNSLAKVKTRLSWSDRDVLILASIVEKEAVDPAERPRIAQVFVNRMTDPDFHPRRLETDPTIRYGCMVPLVKSAACQAWDKHDRLHRAQLDDKDNPYNTYQHDGLPPGPISNPGKSAMAAAMDPDGSNFFFFVAKDASHHHFSRSLSEHKEAVDKYVHGGASN